jgi:hypothetical protein
MKKILGGFVLILIIGFNSCTHSLKKSYDCECGQDAWKYIKGHEFEDFQKEWGPFSSMEVKNDRKEIWYSWKIPGLFQAGEALPDEITIAFETYYSETFLVFAPVGDAKYFYCPKYYNGNKTANGPYN